MSGEFRAISRIEAILGGRPPAGEVWIGDDAAVVGDGLLLATDSIVDGVHVDRSISGLDDIGWKSLAVALSDIAAMGGTATHAVVSVAGPPETAVDLLYRGIADAVEVLGCPVVGGDLVSSPVLVITVSALGRVDGAPVLRSGARPGDSIFVSGALGASAAGLRLLRGGSATGDEVEARAHRRPSPAVIAGPRARRSGATAMIDVSDGFAADLHHLADASGVGFEVHHVPVSGAASLDEALYGGDDYVLIATSPTPLDWLAFELVGVVVADTAVRAFRGSPLERRGWEHQWS